MRKLTISDKEVMGLAVQQEITRSEESRYDHRLHGILLVSRGLSCYQVADWLAIHRRKENHPSSRARAARVCTRGTRAQSPAARLRRLLCYRRPSIQTNNPGERQTRDLKSTSMGIFRGS